MAELTYACVNCAAPIASYGMCAVCSEAFRQKHEGEQQTKIAALEAQLAEARTKFELHRISVEASCRADEEERIAAFCEEHDRQCKATQEALDAAIARAERAEKERDEAKADVEHLITTHRCIEELFRLNHSADIAKLADRDATIQKLAKWIRNNGPGVIDHACAECLPHGEILVEGFRCARHVALALAADPAPKAEAKPKCARCGLDFAHPWRTSDDYCNDFVQSGDAKGEAPIEDLIARSSLGTPEAVALRESVPKAVVDRVLARADEIAAAKSEAPAKPTCFRCRGTRYISAPHPNDAAKGYLIPCPACGDDAEPVAGG